MFTCINKERYLFVELSGEYALSLFINAVHEISKQSEKEHLKKVLVDITKMTGSPSIIDRYETGVEISKYWGTKIQVAAVATESLINFSTETVAVNRGANFRVFIEMNAALKWLQIED